MASSVQVRGDLVEELRLHQMVMNRREAAKAIGITSTALWNIERKPQSTSPPTLRKVAAWLGVKPQELIRK